MRPLALLLLGLGLACGEARSGPVPGGEPCTRCHGGADGAAPPRSVAGATATSDVAVGAHQLHLRDTPIRAALPCTECHRVPTRVADHAGREAILTFGPLATARGATPAWNRGAATCSGVYCHGATLRSPPAAAPTWTYATEPSLSPPSPEVCGRCHGYPPPPHPPLDGCASCHPDTVRADGTVDVAGGRHVDGRVDARGGPCGACHGVPPDTGAHRAHFGDAASPPRAAYGDLQRLADYLPAGATFYMFGCGHCHPLDPARHMDGVVEVELADPAAPAGSLKALAAPTAAYANGTCSGVYCHSSGQAAPTFAATPAWTSGQHLACDGCHGNPPRYPSGGAGADDANSHLVLADDGWELGHFAGLPGPWHGSRHGNTTLNAAPLTCQTCHAATVDPAATGPSGYYWLDTTGSYRLDLPEADPRRLTSASWRASQCSTCHGGSGSAPEAAGRVLPLRHVDGVRNVVFDPRTAIGDLSGYPGAPTDPATAPYWVFTGSAGLWSTSLAGTSYDPTTKTCSNAGCHLLQTSVRWGVRPVGAATCDACHQIGGVQ